MNLDWPTRDDELHAVYARYAPIYDLLFEDTMPDAAYYLRAAAERLVPGDAMLELGVGTGRLTEQFLRAGYRVVGIDSSAEMLERARTRLAPFGDQYRLVHGDMRALALDQQFPLIVAPFGTVAHLLSDDDRARAFRSAHAHLSPGGAFIFDDLPGWVSGRADGTSLDVRAERADPVSGKRLRLQCNTFDAAGEPLSVRYDFIDWMEADDRVAQRAIVRIVFRNIAIADELKLLRSAGFGLVDLFGDFRGTPLDPDRPTENSRLVVRCLRDRD